MRDVNGESGGNTSQQHGIDVENIIKTTWKFPGACNGHRTGNAVHDIERRYDPVFGLDTSIKTTGNGSIPLADATRFYEINVPRRLMSVDWEKIDEETKDLVRIHEFILTMSLLRKVRGDLTATEVLDYHKRIASYPVGPEAAAAARAEAVWIKKEIKERHGILTFHFKIDEYDQRRLQLTVPTAELIALAEQEPDYVACGNSQAAYVLHKDRLCQYKLPFTLISPPRRIDLSKKQAMQATKSETQHETLFEITESSDYRPTASRTAARRTVHRQDERTKGHGGMDLDLQERLFGS